jgi:hypothetical protein
MSDRWMKVSDLPGWGTDYDLHALCADWPVHVEMIDVDVSKINGHGDRETIRYYARIYQEHGPWGMPPVVCMGDAGWRIAGLHRMCAAHLAGLTQVPAFIVNIK